MDRPKITKELDSKTFLSFYYLKEELIEFCRENNLPLTGSKIDITNRIAAFLDNGEVIYTYSRKQKENVEEYTLETIIEENYRFSEKKRAFYVEHLGKRFSFNVPFQRWIKQNVGKTYGESIEAYKEIVKQKKNVKSDIDKQFEYNTYIRDFFSDNNQFTLQDAIKCWKYKKSLQGSHKYERDDLKILK